MRVNFDLSRGLAIALNDREAMLFVSFCRHSCHNSLPEFLERSQTKTPS